MWIDGYRRNQKIRQAASAFAALIANPADSPIKLPASANIFVYAPDGSMTAAVAVTVGDRQIWALPLAANVVHCIGFFELGQTLAINSPFVLAIRTGLNSFSPISSGGGWPPDGTDFGGLDYVPPGCSSTFDFADFDRANPPDCG